MIDISTTATFDRLFDKLPKTIQRKTATKTDLFQANPFHPSLHVEKLHPKHHEVWSFRVDRAYRVIFKFVRPDHAELRYIGHHHSQFNCTYHSQTQNPELRTSLPATPQPHTFRVTTFPYGPTFP